MRKVQRTMERGTALDRLAIMLSGLCVAHCLATLFLVAVLASAGGFLANPLIHEVGLALAVAIGAVALGRGVFLHRRPLPLVVGAVGLGLMATALAAPHGYGEALCTIVGVSLVAIAHQLNRRALA